MARNTKNPAKQRMLKGETVIGVGVELGSPLSAELLSRAGFDFVMVDNQHGAWDEQDTTAAFYAICLGDAVPMARVGGHDFYTIGRLLDRGAMGLIIPLVNSPEEAREVAHAVRYPPQGGRSLGHLMAMYQGDDYLERINDEVFLAVQIESAAAVENAEAIMAVDGIDGCWIGPADLARSMGIDVNTPAGRAAHNTAILKVRDACRKTGKIAGISGDMNVGRWIKQGLQFVTVTDDASLVIEGAKQALNKFRKPA